MKTELIWEGKYDEQGRRVAPLRLALPFQTVETVNESAQDRQANLFQAAQKAKPWRNRLIWGDKKYVLPSLLEEFAGKVDLIYIDPPFDTGADFSFNASVPDFDEEESNESVSFTKQPSLIEQKAYRDTWGRGIDSYINWFADTAAVLHELLATNGALYVHLDYHVSSYAKVILDEVFGADRFLNEIIWKRTTARSGSTGFNHIHDVVLFYSKGPQFYWKTQYTDYTDEYLNNSFRHRDHDGRRWRESPLTAPGLRNGPSGQPWKGVDPSKIGNGRHWAVPGFTKSLLSESALGNPLRALDELEAQGRIVWAREGQGRPNFKQYATDLPGVELQSIWSDFGALSSAAVEVVGYPTQKPERLVERIVIASSPDTGLILDCFCGSGTTPVVAEKLNRRWIACDLGRFAIHTTRKRLLSIPDLRPFVVQNLGKYERQAWQNGLFGGGGGDWIGWVDSAA